MTSGGRRGRKCGRLGRRRGNSDVRRAGIPRLDDWALSANRGFGGSQKLIGAGTGHGTSVIAWRRTVASGGAGSWRRLVVDHCVVEWDPAVERELRRMRIDDLHRSCSPVLNVCDGFCLRVGCTHCNADLASLDIRDKGVDDERRLCGEGARSGI